MDLAIEVFLVAQVILFLITYGLGIELPWWVTWFPALVATIGLICAALLFAVILWVMKQ